MRAFKCTYDEYLDAPEAAVTNLIAVHRAVNKGVEERQAADANAQRAAAAATTPTIN